MVFENKKEIYIKINKLKDTVFLLEEFAQKNMQIKELFVEYEKLKHIENELLNSTEEKIKDINSKVEHITN